MFYFWLGCIIATAFVAGSKGRSIFGFGVLALFTGPIALLIVLSLPSKSTEEKRKSADPFKLYSNDPDASIGPSQPVMYVPLRSSLPSVREEFNGIRHTLRELTDKIYQLESKLTQLSEDQPVPAPQSTTDAVPVPP